MSDFGDELQPRTPLGVGTPGLVDIELQWRDVTYKVGDKEILKGLSGNMLPRRTLAIMGSSGAGKTTFLNAVSDRLAQDKTHIVGGDITLSGVPYKRDYRRLIAFVPQDDILPGTATPTEVLDFSLRIRRGATGDQTAKIVPRMIDELGLERAKDTIVGIPGLIVGLSGGERKRTNIGVELINDPKLLFLDEPTSGLDSVTAENVCKLLHNLSRRGRTVAFTIHQPTSDCLQYFDDILLLVAGKAVYHGAMVDALPYFESIGHMCPDTYSPTDFFMSVMQDDEKGPKLVEAWESYVQGQDIQKNPNLAVPQETNTDATESYLASYQDAGAGYGAQFVELLKRSSRNVVRNKMMIGAQLMQSTIFGIVAMLIFVNLKDTVTGVADRHGLLFMVVANLAFSSVMNMVNGFPPERAVYVREQQAGAYSPALFFLAKSVAELPLQLVSITIACVLIYFPTRLALNASAFFTFWAVSAVVSQVGIGIGFAISIGIENYTVSSGMTPLLVIPMMLAGGFLASTSRLRPYWIWLEKISFIRHGMVLLERNEFERLDHISCDVAKYGADFCSTAPTNGNDVLDGLEFRDGHHHKWLMWLCLGISFVVFRILCVGLLYVVGRRKN